MKKIISKDNGITLISLIVTIIVILILASVATYSGINSVKLSEFNRFTTELKIMQTEVNKLYEKYKNGETINGKEVLTYGTDITIATQSIKQQASIVFTQEASGVTDQIGYKYYNKETIDSLGIEGVEQEFFVNIETRNVISYYGMEYQGKTYYTLSQIPNSIYNVDYNNQNINVAPQIGDVKISKSDDDLSWNVSIENIQYGGYVRKGKVQYQKFGDDYWSEIEETTFAIKEQGLYTFKIIDNAGNESNNIIKYIGNIKIQTSDNIKIIIPGLPNNFQSLSIQYKKTSDENWQNISEDSSFTVTEPEMYNIKFTMNQLEDTIMIYAGDVKFDSADSTSWNFNIDQTNYKIKYKEETRLSQWQQSENNIAKIGEPGTYNIKVIDNNGNESYNYLTQYAYVKDGLVLCYDGINNTGNGHDNSASVWTDLSGNNNDTETLKTNMSWSENSLVFSNSNDTLKINDSIINTINSNEFSIQMIAYDYSYESGSIYPTFLWSTNDNFAFYTSGNLWEYFQVKNNSNARIAISKNGIYNHLVTISFDLNKRKLCGYSDNNLLDTKEIESLINVNDFNINSQQGNNTFKIKSLKIYNKSLTEKEIKQNYEIDKIRYNIDK